MNFYLISPPEECSSFNIYNFEKILAYINVKYLQLRPKYKSEKLNRNFIVKNFRTFQKLCFLRNVKLIINDDVKLAKELESDGVHIGQNDLCCKKARSFLGTKYEIGVSCKNSLILAKQAYIDGANYLAFGPAFKSRTKKNNSTILNKEFFKKKNEIPLPFTLIGGINHTNIGKLKNIGFNNLALIQSIWHYKYGPVKSAEKFSHLGFGHEN